jgi:biotin carboxyl carrier protein
MGHVVMTSELSGVPEHDVLCIEETRDPQRAAVFQFARKVSREPASITSEDVDSLRPYLKDAQIVELVFAVCRYNTMNRLADAFGVPLEKENVFAPPAKTKKKGGAGGTTKPKAAPPATELEDRRAPRRDRSEGSVGVVSAIQGNLVTIAVGSDDRVRAGDWYAISRGAWYVGRIQISRVDPRLSVGTFDAGNPGTGAPPQVGDKASPSGD